MRRFPSNVRNNTQWMYQRLNWHTHKGQLSITFECNSNKKLGFNGSPFKRLQTAPNNSFFQTINFNESLHFGWIETFLYVTRLTFFFKMQVCRIEYTHVYLILHDRCQVYRIEYTHVYSILHDMAPWNIEMLLHDSREI